MDGRRTYRILQVGCGPTGVSVMRQLLPRFTQAGVPVSYTVAEPGTAGPGLAFATPYDLHLLNVQANLMSLNPEDAGEFARWRGEHESTWAAGFAEPAVGWDDYPPRRLFGMYLRSVFDDVVRSAHAAGQRLELITEQAVALRRSSGDGRWRVKFASGLVAEYDTVILAVGHLPSTRYSPEEGQPGFLRDPWRDLQLPPHARVGVIGTRLTGVDTALALRERGHQGPILLASRSGWLPSVRGSIAAHQLRYLPDFVAERRRMGQEGTVSLEAVAEVIGREVQAAERAPIDWRSAIHPSPSTADSLRAELSVAESGRVIGWQSVLASVVSWVPALWQLLDERSRTLLMNSYGGGWVIRVAPFPAVSARRLLQMMGWGQLSIRAGLAAVVRSGTGYEMRFRNGGSVGVDVVINSTGPGYGRDSLEAAPLTRDLLWSGLAVPHRYGGINVDKRTFQVVDAGSAVAQGIHVVGDLTRGVWLATNAVENTVRQTAMLAEVITECLPR